MQKIEELRYIETLLRGQGRIIEVVNHAKNGTEDLLADLISIIYCFCAGMCQKWAILLDSVDLVHTENCQVDLTHALRSLCIGNLL